MGRRLAVGAVAVAVVAVGIGAILAVALRGGDRDGEDVPKLEDVQWMRLEQAQPGPERLAALRHGNAHDEAVMGKLLRWLREGDPWATGNEVPLGDVDALRIRISPERLLTVAPARECVPAPSPAPDAPPYRCVPVEGVVAVVDYRAEGSPRIRRLRSEELSSWLEWRWREDLRETAEGAPPPGIPGIADIAALRTPGSLMQPSKTFEPGAPAGREVIERVLGWLRESQVIPEGDGRDLQPSFGGDLAAHIDLAAGGSLALSPSMDCATQSSATGEAEFAVCLGLRGYVTLAGGPGTAPARLWSPPLWAWLAHGWREEAP